MIIVTSRRDAVVGMKDTDNSCDVALICAEGQLMGGPETFNLSDEIEKLYVSGCKNIVLDLSDVAWANSHAIGMIIKWFVTVRDHGGDIRFAGLNERLRSYMNMTRLISVIPTYANKDDAMRSFH